MTDPRTAREPMVWIIPPTVTGNDPVFPWTWNGFYRDPRLIVKSSAQTKESNGAASFELLRITHYAPGGPDFLRQVSSFRVGCYVLITTNSVDDITDPDNPVERPEVDEVSWFGVITATDFEIADTGEYFGTCTGMEVGESILDAQRIEGFRQASGTLGTTYEMTSPPPANMNGSGSKVIGNATLDQDDDGNPIYVFTKELADCGSDPIVQPSKFWTLWRLLTHVATFCSPFGTAKLRIALEDESGSFPYSFPGGSGTSLLAYLDSAIAPEVVELDGLTLRGAIDLIVGAGRGLGWRLEPAYINSEYVWRITVYSRSELDATFGPPKKEPDPQQRILSISYIADDKQTKSLQFSEDDSSRYDEVVVQGGQIVFGATLSKLDGNLDKAWNAAQEAAYIIASGPKRDSPAFADVYRSFVLTATTRATNPGLNDAALPLCPLVTWAWDPTTKIGTASISISVSGRPYVPTLRFRSDVPWLDGVDPETGLNIAGTVALASPSYMRPAVYRYEVTSSFPWIDLLARTRSTTFTPIGESPSVDIEERRAGVRVAYSIPQILALDTYVAASAAGEATPAYDWRKMLVTVGIPSDQKLEVRKLRKIGGADIAANRIRRTLIVRDDSLNFWCCLSGTVVGTNATNSAPLRVGVNTQVVNDYAAAQLYCDQLAEWAFRPHESVVIQHANDGSTINRWKVGMSLARVVDGQTSRHISGIVASLETDWENATVTLRSEIPPQPGRMGGGQSASPSRGGAVSSELGGTLAQVVQRQGAQQQKVASQVAARALIPATFAFPDRPSLFVVQGGQTFTAFGIFGITKILTALDATTLPVGTPPASGTTVNVPAWPIPAGLPDGIGVGRLYGTTTYQFILLDSTAPCGNDLIQSQPCFTEGNQSFTKVSGGINYVYNCAVAFCGF